MVDELLKNPVRVHHGDVGQRASRGAAAAAVLTSPAAPHLPRSPHPTAGPQVHLRGAGVLPDVVRAVGQVSSRRGRSRERVLTHSQRHSSPPLTARRWAEQDEDVQAKVQQLVANGQLEFVNGGWTMHDEVSSRSRVHSTTPPRHTPRATWCTPRALMRTPRRPLRALSCRRTRCIPTWSTKRRSGTARSRASLVLRRKLPGRSTPLMRNSVIAARGGAILWSAPRSAVNSEMKLHLPPLDPPFPRLHATPSSRAP